MNYNVTTSTSNSGDDLWTSITGSSPVFLTNTDDNFLQTSNIGFDFPFAGLTYRTVFISQNGYLTFGNSSTQYIPRNIPNSYIPYPAIFAYFNDLSTDAVNSESVCYKIYATKLVIEYPKSYSRNGGVFVNLQITLFNTGVIKLLYNPYIFTDYSVYSASSAKIGIQASGTDGINYDVLNLMTNNSYHAITFTPTSAVTKTTPTIATQPNASAITYGQTLANSTLSGGAASVGAASVGGTFTFTIPSTAPNAGTTSQGYTFTPNDTANYNTVTGTVNVTVNKATPTVTSVSATSVTSGSQLSSSTLSGTKSTLGNLVFTAPSTIPSSVGTANYGWTFTPNDTNNYNVITGSVSVTVNSISSSPSNSGPIIIISSSIPGSNEDLFYNRDRNISGVLAPENISTLNFYPAYGSRVEFTAKSFSYETTNSYYNILPNSLNSLKAKYRMRYDLNEDNAAKLINFLESKSGYLPFAYSSDINIYKSLSGYCENYAVNHMNNNHYEVAAEIDIDQAPTLLNWSGMTFLNHNFKNFSLATSYKKYDVVYTGVNSNKLNNFYYCSGDHTSSALNSPTGINSAWTQEFFFEPDIGLQNDVKLEVKPVDFKNSFYLRIKTKKNIAPINVNYKFSNISNAQLKSMLHFLENKAGYRRFKHQIPSVYNRPKVFTCPQWSHTWKYYNSNDLDVSFIEDALGIIPSDT